MQMIFVNLPVADLAASRSFFTGLGFKFNAQFSDESVACMVIDQNIYVMLMLRDRFQDFINGQVCDAATCTEVITCLTATSREQVDHLVNRAIAAGGRPWKPALSDGPMYGGSFQDLDGHVWEIMHMDPVGS